jgi:hypothetical protein
VEKKKKIENSLNKNKNSTKKKKEDEINQDKKEWIKLKEISLVKEIIHSTFKCKTGPKNLDLKLNLFEIIKLMFYVVIVNLFNMKKINPIKFFFFNFFILIFYFNFLFFFFYFNFFY